MTGFISRVTKRLQSAAWLGLALAAAVVLMNPLLARAQWYDPQSGEPPPGTHQHFTSNEWNVVPTTDGTGINGTASLECYSDELDELILRLRGLVHGGVYTVWLLRTEGENSVERAGVAVAWDGPKAKKFSFLAEDDGHVYYRGCLSQCPLGRWKHLEVRYHPNGNVGDLQFSVPVVHMKLRPK